MKKIKDQKTEKQIQASWEDMFSFCRVNPSSFQTLQRKINYSFKTIDHLYEALSHRSALVAYQKFCIAQGLESKKPFSCYERIEFLGDSVLGLVISWILWDKKNKSKKPYKEGELSRVKAFLISESTLADLAMGMELHRYIALSSSEKNNSGDKRVSLLADCLEALIGAIFIDGGYKQAEKFIRKLYKQTLELDLQEVSYDYKSRLQEIIQEKEKMAPRYEMLDSSGPDHAKHFKVAVYTAQKKLATAWGASKKKASQEAAKQALLRFSKKKPQPQNPKVKIGQEND